MRQNVVSYADGELSIRFSIPEAPARDRAAPADHVDSIARFYPFDPPAGLTLEQAHALLSFRDFGRAAAEHIFPRLHSRRAADAAAIFAAFACSDPAVGAEVLKWAEARFRRGAKRQTAAGSIPKASFWPAVQGFAAAFVADLSGQGMAFGRD